MHQLSRLRLSTLGFALALALVAQPGVATVADASETPRPDAEVETLRTEEDALGPADEMAEEESQPEGELGEEQENEAEETPTEGAETDAQPDSEDATTEPQENEEAEETKPLGGAITSGELRPTPRTLSRASYPAKREYLMPVLTGQWLGTDGRYDEYKWTSVNPWNWASVRCSSSAAEGTNIRVTSACTQGKLTTTLLNPTTRKVVSTKTVNLPNALPKIGGVETINGQIFLLTGQDNLQEKDNVTVYRVDKYNTSLGHLGSTSITSGKIWWGVQQPFKAGSPSMAMVGDTLYIHLGRQILKMPDGLNHQVNLTLTLNAKNMTNFEDHDFTYASHSFNQFARSYGGGKKLLLADHGDAHPRSIFGANLHIPTSSTKTSGTVLKLLGETGDNYTYATLNGVEIAGSKAGFVGTSAPQGHSIAGVTGIVANKAGQYASNIYFATFDLNATGSSTTPNFRWVTSFNPKTSNTIIGEPTVTALPSGHFVVLYQVTTPDTWARTLHYVLLDNNGSRVADKSFSGFAYLPSSDPVLIGSKLYWVGAPQVASQSIDSDNTNQVLMGLDLANRNNPSMLKVPEIPFDSLPKPVISGEAAVGKTVTVTKASASDFKPAATSLTYQWLRDDKAISGATQSTYKLTPADEYKQVSVVVTGKRQGYLTSSTTSAKVRVSPGTLEFPSAQIVGDPVFGSTLTAKNVEPSDFKPKADKVSYQWLRDWEPIPGATSKTYKLTVSDIGKQIGFRLTASKEGYYTQYSSRSYATVSAASFTTIPTPKISGTPTFGQTLTATGAAASNFKPAADKVTCQWLRDGKNISGATKNTYKLTNSDVGKKITGLDPF